jgi:hypothetical protein
MTSQSHNVTKEYLVIALYWTLLLPLAATVLITWVLWRFV